MDDRLGDSLDDTTVDLDETGPQSPQPPGGRLRERRRFAGQLGEANLILISHPENRQLGKRFRLGHGETVEIGRSKSCELSFSEVLSLSRSHGRLQHGDDGVSFEDLGSTNGSFVNDRRVVARVFLASGDRLQLGSLHFKFLHGDDVEHDYYEAIYNLMTQDGLTEIYNRRTFDEEFQREYSRAKRHNRPLSLVLFDVDDFKEINDRCGHLCGDFVLKAIVGLIRRQLRTEQVFARVGGDEFAVLCPETDDRGGRILAEKMRSRIAAHEFRPELLETAVRTTCSFGVAGLKDDMTTSEEFYAAADQALYDAKHLGRNRVGVFGSEPGGGAAERSD